MRRPRGERLSVLDEVLRAQARHRRTWRVGRAALVLLAAVTVLWIGLATRPPSPGRALPPAVETGAVTGYIQPCSGLPFPERTSTGAPVFSAAALVEALPGQEYMKSVGHGAYLEVFPTDVAARDRVAQNQQFRLADLAPGRYVILARYAPGDASTFLEVSVAPGQVAEVELPNPCI